MALLDIFKKKKGEKKVEKPEKKKEIKKEKKVEKEKIEKKVEEKPVAPKRERKIIGNAHRVIRVPHVVEKATELTAFNQYVFKVWPRANKTEVKKAIEDIFGVDVVSVGIINLPKKKRRLGKVEGFRKGYKKAIVKIKEGQKIEVLPK